MGEEDVEAMSTGTKERMRKRERRHKERQEAEANRKARLNWTGPNKHHN